MRTSQSLLFSIIFLVFSTFTIAWPWPRWLPELDTLVVRQNINSGSSSPSKETNSPAPTDNPKSQSGITAAPSNTNSPDSSNSKSSGGAKQTGSGSNTDNNGGGNSGSNSTSATKTHTTSYDARLPAGGISMITPAVIDGQQYFKVGDFVTFAWNYTSLLATPSAVNIMATCKANSQLYTIATNQTIGNSTGAVTWDTGSYQATAVSDPLLTETYTLIIYDAAGSMSDTAQAGYLAVYNQYSFGMYTPQAYVPLAEFKCATCSGALSDMERRALGMVVGMGMLTVLSFTWFVGGTGVIW